MELSVHSPPPAVGGSTEGATLDDVDVGVAEEAAPPGEEPDEQPARRAAAARAPTMRVLLRGWYCRFISLSFGRCAGRPAHGRRRSRAVVDQGVVLIAAEGADQLAAQPTAFHAMTSKR